MQVVNHHPTDKPRNPYAVLQTPRKPIVKGKRDQKCSAPDQPSPKKRKLFGQSEVAGESVHQKAIKDSKARRILAPDFEDFTPIAKSQETSESQADTQEVDYTACSQIQHEESMPHGLRDVFGFDIIPFTEISGKSQMFIGRANKNDVVVDIPEVSREHCILSSKDGEFYLSSRKRPCWVATIAGRWELLNPRQIRKLSLGQSFRLLPPSPNIEHHAVKRIQFCVSQMNSLPKDIDTQYLGLLRSIERNGKQRQNKKGLNKTLPQLHTMEIDLSSDDDKMILPIISLRKIWHQGSKMEALWYLRGEGHIKFLQENRCSFWDAQASNDGFLGLNYGLLTNFPLKDGGRCNQLEEKVIDNLVAGKSSRNMLCSMICPSEVTEQTACTSSIQFAVSDGRLDLTVTQRSSDVILGLPHDVIVWSIISHLVRREVERRSEGKIKLRAGTLYFTISAGGAHVYKVNEDNFEELLRRRPIPYVQPHLVVDGEEEGIFEIAQNYKKGGKTQLRVLGYNNGDYHSCMEIDQAV